MKNAVFVIVFTLFAFGAIAQKSFIGQTKEQIREYWSLHVSDQYFEEGVWDDTGEAYFVIQAGNVGAPDFEATFDKAGKCISQSSRLDPGELSVYKARLKKLGFVYSQSKELWSKAGTRYVWKIESYTGGNYSLIAERI